MKLVSLVLAIMLIGCATVSDVRKSDPVETILSRKSAKKMHNCFVQSPALQEGSAIFNPLRMVQTEEDGVYTVTAYTDNLMFTSVDTVIMFKPKDDGGCIVEIRKGTRPGMVDFYRKYLIDCDAKP
jgi:hypothetical protein